MQSKSLLIAIAAFAVTATGVQAYGGAKMLSRAGLNEDQIEAFEEARELRAAGDRTAARDRLVEAGITENTMHLMRQASHGAKNAIHEALADGDYEAFRLAIADSPLSDIVTSKADFQQFKEAHDLRRTSGWKMPDSLTDDLEIEESSVSNPHSLISFTEAQREAFQVARQANDRATMQAILDEAGVSSPVHHHFSKH